MAMIIQQLDSHGFCQHKIVNFLGVKDNILNVEVNKSRCKVTLNDVSKVNKEAIQKLGARGIVEIDNQLKIILVRTLKH